MTARGELQVLTFKDGLLARIAHDLQIRATDWQATREGDVLVVRVVLRGLRVEGAVVGGRVDPRALSAGDLAKIERTMNDEVLATTRWPEARFDGTIDPTSMRVRGRLALHGRTVDLAPITVRTDGELLRAELTLTPSRWDIAPYRALAGALKLQDRIVIRIALLRADMLDAPG